MLEPAPKRDVTKSMDLNVKIPPEIETPVRKIVELVKLVVIPKRDELEEKPKDWEDGFIDVEETKPTKTSKTKTRR